MSNESQSEKLKSDNPTPASRVGFERLRERTDELELLISGLALFGLISLPSWMLDKYPLYLHRMPIEIMAMTNVVPQIATAACYLMAGLLLGHLALRAYWVGLIGLKSAYPAGINWSRMKGIGSLVKVSAAARLSTLGSAIERADRRASVLFSLVVFTASGTLILGAWILLIFVIALLFGPVFGGSNAFLEPATFVLLVVIVCTPLLLWLLDGVIAIAFPKLRMLTGFRGLISVLFFVERLFFPLRLMGQTRYTLQSNTLPRVFFPLFVCLLLLAIYLSNKFIQYRSDLDVFGNHTYLDSLGVKAGHYSARYESQLVPFDRSRFFGPMIPDPIIETAWLPLFLPYQPVIDNPLLAERCAKNTLQQSAIPPSGQGDSDAAANARDLQEDKASTAAQACLAKLWSVSLDGVEQSLEGFITSQRFDLGLRGLTGYIPLNGLFAGPHELVVFWRPSPEQDSLENDFIPGRKRHVIPFVWSPGVAAKPKLTAEPVLD